MQAAALGHTSIAFPALGTGNLRYPEQNVARCMIETVVDYTENNPNSSIKDVKIVVFHMDQRTMQVNYSMIEADHLFLNRRKTQRGPENGQF